MDGALGEELLLSTKWEFIYEMAVAHNFKESVVLVSLSTNVESSVLLKPV